MGGHRTFFPGAYAKAQVLAPRAPRSDVVLNGPPPAAGPGNGSPSLTPPPSASASATLTPTPASGGTSTPTAVGTATPTPIRIATPTATRSPTSAPTAAPTPASAPVLYVLAGQSNLIAGAPLPDTAAEDAAISTFDWGWRKGLPVGGIAVSFARARAPTDGRVGVLNCAVGGSAILDWARDMLGPGNLYDACLARIRASGLRPAAILFYQGEADARTDVDVRGYPPDPDHWARDFGTVVDAFRTDLGDSALPVLFARIAYTTDPVGYPRWPEVQAQQDIASRSNALRVPMSGVTLRDEVHLDDASAAFMGWRFADAYHALTGR